jgi:hypothetical protein
MIASFCVSWPKREIITVGLPTKRYRVFSGPKQRLNAAVRERDEEHTLQPRGKTVPVWGLIVRRGRDGNHSIRRITEDPWGRAVCRPFNAFSVLEGCYDKLIGPSLLSAIG